MLYCTLSTVSSVLYLNNPGAHLHPKVHTKLLNLVYSIASVIKLILYKLSVFQQML